MLSQRTRLSYALTLAGLTLALLVAGTGPLWGDHAAMAAKGKGKGKATKTVTRTFSSDEPITLPSSGAANPYPSLIEVSGLAKGKIVDINLTINGFSHTFADDADLLLVKSTTDLIVMSDAGGNNAAADLNLTLDDDAAAGLPDTTALASGTFLPTNHLLSGADTFPAPAPAPSGSTGLEVFNGLNPNGVWQLFVSDDLAGGAGSIDSWELEITAKVKGKKHGKGGKSQDASSASMDNATAPRLDPLAGEDGSEAVSDVGHDPARKAKHHRGKDRDQKHRHGHHGHKRANH